MSHPLVEAIKEMLLEKVVNQGIINFGIEPGFSRDKLLIRLDVFDRATTTHKAGFRGEEGKPREGEWHMLDVGGKPLEKALPKKAKQPHLMFVDWLVDVLKKSGLNPQQPRTTPGFERPEETDIANQIDIEIDRLLTHARDVSGVTDEQKFDTIIKGAPRPSWFWIEGNPDMGFWQVVTKIDEPFEQDISQEVGVIQQQKEAEAQKLKDKAVFDFMEIVNRLADQSGVIRHIMLLAVQLWLEKQPGFSHPFDIQGVSLEEAQRALEEIKGLAFQDVEAYVSSLEGKAGPEAIGPMKPLTEPER